MAGKNTAFQVWKTARPDVFLHDGEKVTPPGGWSFVSAGDPGLTRRLKTSGECWVVVHRRKNRVEALGLLTEATRAAEIKTWLEAERGAPSYRQKLESARKRRETEQAEYETEFREAVLQFLAFAPCYGEVAQKLAGAVTVLAAPVGSGTVARTERIPLARRAEAAVIAWLRHQTTAYDRMPIARIRGERREVRRDLAERSRRLLEKYRTGEAVDPAACPLAQALK